LLRAVKIILKTGVFPIQPKDFLDITSDLCPITLVKILLALDSLGCGDVLEVHLSAGSAAKNVPRSLAGGGHIIRSMNRLEDGTYIMHVEKCGGDKSAKQ
jgi:tRNA 2-thiouridine synthesizing protein A